jgi:hypothetical protein
MKSTSRNRGFVMRKLQAIAACLALLLSGLTPLWGDNKKQKNTKKTVSEETYLGSISCTVKTFKVAPQPPAVDDAALPNPGNNPAPRNPRNDNALQNHGDNPAPQTQGANAVPPAAPGDAASPTPAQNLSATKPIATLKDCLVHGGQVVMLVDGTQKGILIDNPDAIKGHEWHRLSISGYMRGSAFHVISVRII